MLSDDKPSSWVSAIWLGVLVAPNQILDPNGGDPIEIRFAGKPLRVEL